MKTPKNKNTNFGQSEASSLLSGRTLYFRKCLVSCFIFLTYSIYFFIISYENGF